MDNTEHIKDLLYDIQDRLRHIESLLLVKVPKDLDLQALLEKEPSNNSNSVIKAQIK